MTENPHIDSPQKANKLGTTKIKISQKFQGSETSNPKSNKSDVNQTTWNSKSYMEFEDKLSPIFKAVR